MAEDSWLKVTRQYFADTNARKLEMPVKKINKILEVYNRYLQKCLIGESPFVAEDLKLTILKSRGKNEIVTEQEDK